jgi:peptidoglycan endopeptidase LytE
MNFDNSRLNTSQPVARPIDSNVVGSSKSTTITSTYKVQSGDSLSKIASKFNTNISTLAKLNNIKNVNFIRVGQVLKINGTSSAVKTSTSTKTITYTVRKGDIVSKIAANFGVSSIQIKNLNHLNSKYTIYPNQKLRIK